MAYTFENRKTYSFTLYPAAVLGTSYNNVTVLSILDYATANRFFDIEALHRQVYRYLPEGTPDRAADFNYLLVKVNEVETIIGVPWIEENSITLIENLRMTVTLEGVSTSDVLLVRECLSQNGFSNFEIRLNDSTTV